ncbi:VOC family protein [Natronomonas sp. CBA1123]|jgi:catechol 2,3-dioxygenase-like lactoylglutathione lyase family enzyme|uniref:VOC family protein n=1 Tax=Natronomonas sp. CBA1123 TaxID=2668070 RepID=UPI0012E9E2E8|nr:VOC family protein [Natronomonas sp. CBA1123]MUV86358.1 VOC family protein [Natronomonas sp. CBA1123]
MTDLTAHHVGLTVSDLDRAVAFYRDTLGLEVVSRFEVGGEAFATAVDVDGASGTFAHLDADGVRIELVEYDPEGAASTSALNQPGACHVGFAVEDVDAFVAGLSDDVETISEPQTTESGTRLVFLRDPDGNRIELLEA